MKKLLLIVLLVLTTSLTACNNEEVSTDNQVERTITGVAAFQWHIPITTFNVTVHVTFKGDTITEVRINEASFYETGDYDIWVQNQDTYLAQYVGLTVEQVKSFEIIGEATDKIYVGELIGDVYVVTGASATSLAVAKAVMNAVSKY